MTGNTAQWEIEKAHPSAHLAVEPREFIRFLLANFFIVVFCILIGVFLSWLAFLRAPRAYEATGTFMVDELPFVQPLQQTDAETERQLIQTLILSIANREMRNAVISKLDLSPEQLAFVEIDKPLTLLGKKPKANVKVVPVKNSRLGSIKVDSQNAQFAADIVNAILDELQLYNAIGGKFKNIQIQARFLKSQAESMLQQLVDVSTKRIRLEREKAEMETYLEKKLPLASFPAFANDDTLNNIKTQLMLVEAEYKSLASARTRGPRLAGKTAELVNLRTQLKQYAGSLAEALRSEYEISLTQEKKLQADQKKTTEDIESLSQATTDLAQSFGDPRKMRAIAANNPDGENGTANMIVVVNRATPPPRPSRPKLLFYILFGVALGGLLGAALVALRMFADTHLKSIEQLEAQVGLPCLAALPKYTAFARSAVRSNLSHFVDFPPGLGFLRSHLFSLLHREEMVIIGFSPLSGGERSSSLVADLAVLLAQSEKRTLVIDLHFSNPLIARLLGVTVRNGLESCLESDQPLSTCINASKLHNLAILAPTKSTQVLADQISKKPMAALLDPFSKNWDFVLIDSPCILSDWSLTFTLTKGQPLIFTANFRQVHIDSIRHAWSRARSFQWNVEGVILMDVPRRLAT